MLLLKNAINLYRSRLPSYATIKKAPEIIPVPHNLTLFPFFFLSFVLLGRRWPFPSREPPESAAACNASFFCFLLFGFCHDFGFIHFCFIHLEDCIPVHLQFVLQKAFYVKGISLVEVRKLLVPLMPGDIKFV